jgi:diguanylate cyclase (GGDEF)-like protein
MMNEKKRYNIAVLMGGIQTYLPQQLLIGIHDAAVEMDVNISYFLAINTKMIFRNMIGKDIGNVYDYQLNTIYDYSLLSGADGVIINYGSIGIYLDQSDPGKFAGRYNSVPLVVLSETADIPNAHYLISDNYQGIRMIMDHLIREHGYRKILFVSGPETNMDSQERKRGYQDAMREAGLFCDNSMMAVGDYYEYVDDQVETLLDRNPDAEAIVFANDEMTLAGYRVCEKRGLKVGQDIAITGYDDGEIAASMNPPLTTVSQDGITIGRQAVMDLVNRLRGGSAESRHIPVKLVCRQSCGCRKQEDISHRSMHFIFEEYRSLSDRMAHMKRESLEFQRKSWFLPYFSRDLSNYTEDDEQFYRQIILDLKRISPANMFLFLLEQPILYEYGDVWNKPENLYLTACCRNGRVKSYPAYARPEINKDCCMSELLNDGEEHQYSNFLLFSNEKQYGLLTCDIKQPEFHFFHMLSLQLGLVLRYHEMSQYEAAYRLEMSKSMEQMKQRNHELDLISGYDALTGLANLRGFMEQIGKMRPSAGKLHSCMIYADLDHLKEINDTWGHKEGDFAIEAAGQILKKCLRDTDIVGRIGGDEFLALVFTDSDAVVENLRERIRKACDELNETSGKPYYVELSVGMVDFDYRTDTNIQTIIAQADTKLYENKKFRKKSVNRQWSGYRS